jgi:hypothetical protein
LAGDIEPLRRAVDIQADVRLAARSFALKSADFMYSEFSGERGGPRQPSTETLSRVGSRQIRA